MGHDHSGELLLHDEHRLLCLSHPGTRDSVGSLKDCPRSHCLYRCMDANMSYASFYRMPFGCEGEAMLAHRHINVLLVESPANGKS